MTEPRHPEQAQAVDVDLVDLLRNDFVAFCHSHQLTLTRFAYDHLGSRAEAEDIVADVLAFQHGTASDDIAVVVVRVPAPDPIYIPLSPPPPDRTEPSS